MNDAYEREAEERALSRTTPDQGGSTYWDYLGYCRTDPRVQADEALGRRAARDQGGNTLRDYEEAARR